MLAQSEYGMGDVFLWAAALVVLVILGFGLVTLVKKRINTDEAPKPLSAGFTLSDLRQMHDSGQLTDAEFERAKSKIIAVAKAPVPKPVEKKNV